MNDRPPRRLPGAKAGEAATPAAATRPGQRLITMMLLAAAALDLTRCGLVLATARHPAPAAARPRSRDGRPVSRPPARGVPQS